ncbi:MAG: histidine triad protein [Acidobacteria bacterium]|nr:histidine triad protein [Acidobacteriota bacterium]
MIETCIFCRVIADEIPAPIVFEDERTIAFLDHRPVFPGHCLLVPREHFETLTDLPVKLIDPVFRNTQLLARAIELALEAEGTFVAINNRVSQSVPHLHVHIVPRRRKDGLRGFFWPRRKYESDDQMQLIQKAIKTAITNLQK